MSTNNFSCLVPGIYRAGRRHPAPGFELFCFGRLKSVWAIDGRDVTEGRWSQTLDTQRAVLENERSSGGISERMTAFVPMGRACVMVRKTVCNAGDTPKRVRFGIGYDIPEDSHVIGEWTDGEEAARRTLPEAFTFPAPTAAVQFVCGDGSSDRFKAKVGDGVYDDVRLYDAALPAAEVLQLALAGSAEKMAPAPFPGLSFAFACPTNRYASARQLLRLSGGGGRLPQLALSTTGASGRLALVLKTAEGAASLESADTFDLRVPCAVPFDVRDGRLVWNVAGAEQGRVPFAGAAADFAQAACARGVRFVPPPATAAFARRDRLALRAGEERLWGLSDAQRRADGARRGVTLNGYWRVQPVDDFTPAPPSGDWRYVRVPGSFRSPLWGYHRLVGGRISDEVSHVYGGRETLDFRAAWYQRGFATPARTPGERIWLSFENLNGDTGRVYLNGRQVCAFSRSGKIHPAVPNERRIDVTDVLARDGGLNVLSVYVDRHFLNLWKGRPSIGDHGEVALGDVWLEAAPGRTALAAGVAMPSFREKRVTLRARLANPSGETGRAQVRFDFVRDGKVAFSSARDATLTGEDGQRLVWTAPWSRGPAAAGEPRPPADVRGVGLPLPGAAPALRRPEAGLARAGARGPLLRRHGLRPRDGACAVLQRMGSVRRPPVQREPP